MSFDNSLTSVFSFAQTVIGKPLGSSFSQCTCPADPPRFFDMSLNKVIWNVPANNDVASIGVIVYFLSAAAIAILTSIPLFLINVNLSPFRPDLSVSWQKSLQRLLLTLSDQQLLTGIALQVATFSTSCETSRYYAEVVWYLGMLSTTVHLLALINLREVLDAKPWLRNMRIIAMGVNVAFWFTVATTANKDYSMPVACGWRLASHPQAAIAGMVGFAEATALTSVLAIYSLLAMANRSTKSAWVAVLVMLLCFAGAGDFARHAIQLKWKPAAMNVRISTTVPAAEPGADRVTAKFDQRALLQFLPLFLLLHPLFAAVEAFFSEKQQERQAREDLEAKAGLPPGYSLHADIKRYSDAYITTWAAPERPRMYGTEGMACMPSSFRGVGSLASGILVNPFSANERKKWNWSM